VFSVTDTIVAIATPPGRGGIGVVRISGAEAVRIARALTRIEQFEPRYATLTRIHAEPGPIDRALVTHFPAPHSYTGEAVVEISAHGSPVLLRAIVSAAMAEGARLAQPGEFTLRAYLNGQIDLVQAEAVRDLVDAVTPLQARAAFDQLEGTLTGRIADIHRALFDLTARLEASLDFSGEGYHFIDPVTTAADARAIATDIDALLREAQRGRLIREGITVVITGKPNTGKSSLFNRLAGAGRAIVTDIAGTTRDLLTENIEIAGVPVTLVDTAGLRVETTDVIEAEGIARARGARDVASVTLIVLDRSRPLDRDDEALLVETETQRRVIVANKSDLPAAWTRADAVHVSALDGTGLEQLGDTIVRLMGYDEDLRDTPAITNIRHVDLLARARQSLESAARAAQNGVPEEFVLTDIHEARGLLEQVTGTRTVDDVLERIFATFCIGK
jgi:tRNA modification GTPase